MKMLPVEDPRPSDDVRELTPEEIKKYVEPGYLATNNSLPDPRTSTFVGVIREGRVVASLGLQVKLHAQPLQIEDGYASVLPALVRGAEDLILKRTGPQWVYLFAPAGKLAQIASCFGMQLEPWVVMSKLVMPEAPAKQPIELVPPLEDVQAEGDVQ